MDMDEEPETPAPPAQGGMAHTPVKGPETGGKIKAPVRVE